MTDTRLSAGQRLGDFVIRGYVDGGATSEVYEAVDAQGALVALKVLHECHRGDGDLLARFVHEAEPILVDRLQHPGLPRVLAISIAADAPAFIAMELLGESLANRLRSGPLLLADAIRVTAELAAVLAYLHQRGVIHRDVKPANVLQSGGGPLWHVKLVDLGQAKLPREEQSAWALSTAVGGRCGTVEYRAPEQWQCAKTVTDRADIYSLGIVLYELLVGAPPFQGSAGRLRLQHVMTPAPALPAPEPLRALCLAMLAKQPAARPSAQQIVSALQELL